MKAAGTLLATAALLAGCAVTRIDANVHTSGRWPESRPPGSYAFQRLPSQEADPQAQDRLEAQARPVIEAAGFVPTSPPEADVWVQVAARSTMIPAPFGDPFVGPFWAGGYVGAWRGPAWGWGGGWGWGYAPAYTVPWVNLTEASVLIVDARTRQPLYESRAQTTDSAGESVTREALFRAAMRDFPYPAVSPRTVSIPLPLPPAAGASAPAK